MVLHTALGWHVELEFEEDQEKTRAAALVRLPDGNEVRSRGYASRHHTDTNQPRVGEEIGGARAQRVGDAAAHEGARRDRRGVGEDVASADALTGSR